MKGADRWQRGIGWITAETTCRCQQESGAESVERNSTLVEVFNESAIGATEAAGCIWELEVELANSADVGVLSHDFFRRAAVSISLSRTR